jgi:hypothetical protein
VVSALSVAIASLLLVTSGAGLLFGTRGLYRPDPATMPTFIGQDALSLVVGLPLLIGSMRLAQRGSLRGLLLWAGALFYFAYSYSYYVLSPEFNALYVAYLAIVSMSLVARPGDRSVRAGGGGSVALAPASAWVGGGRPDAAQGVVRGDHPRARQLSGHAVAETAGIS